MGIKNLTQLILKKSPNSIQTAGIYTLKDKKIAIDTSILIYKSLTNDKMISKRISNKELSRMLDLNYHTKRVNIIFKRIF